MTTPPTRVLEIAADNDWFSTYSPKLSATTFDVQNGDLLVLVAMGWDVSQIIGTPTWDGTGTWSLQKSIVVTGYNTAYLFTCPVTATATGRRITVTRTSGTNSFSFRTSLWRNHGGVGASAKANVASGAPSLSLATSANSGVYCGNADYVPVDGSARVWRTVNGSPMGESAYQYMAGGACYYVALFGLGFGNGFS